MVHAYKTKGVCSSHIKIDISDGIINSVLFTGGCNGNTNGIAALAVGQNAAEFAGKLKNVKCGTKSSSCPAELARAISEALEMSEKKDSRD